MALTGGSGKSTAPATTHTGGSGATAELRGHCPLGCGYFDTIPACVRLHLIQHHNYGYAEAQTAYPDEDVTQE